VHLTLLLWTKPPTGHYVSYFKVGENCFQSGSFNFVSKNTFFYLFYLSVPSRFFSLYPLVARGLGYSPTSVQIPTTLYEGIRTPESTGEVSDFRGQEFKILLTRLCGAG